jgi:hypothetical protein
MGANGAGIVIDDRDWVDELIDAGVLVPVGSDDSNGNPIYRLREFPAGERGRRLRRLFDEHVQAGDGQRREGCP